MLPLSCVACDVAIDMILVCGGGMVVHVSHVRLRSRASRMRAKSVAARDECVVNVSFMDLHRMRLSACGHVRMHEYVCGGGLSR